MLGRTLLIGCVLLCLGISGSGCARAARDTTGFAAREEITVSAPFEETWHAVKAVLREQGYDLYTRDKRGAFVAYTQMRRHLWGQPRRTKFTVELARVTPEETAVAVESVRQVYGVTLLTHPNWHDRKQTDLDAPGTILEGIRAKLASGELDAERFLEENAAEEAPGEAETMPDADEAPAPESTVDNESQDIETAF